MVVLADEVLESFFETDLSASFRLEPVPDLDLPASNSGILGDIWSNIATTDNKNLFNKFTDGIGKTIGKHQVSAHILSRMISTNTITIEGHSPTFNRPIYQVGGAQSSRISAHAFHALIALQIES